MCDVEAIFDNVGVCTVEGGVLVTGLNDTLELLFGDVGGETVARGEPCALPLVVLSEFGPELLLGALKCSEPEGMYTEVVRALAGGVVLFLSIAVV